MRCGIFTWRDYQDMRVTAKEFIDSLKRGEEFVITFRGKPCAKLFPYQTLKRQTETNELFGMWEDNDMAKNVDEYIRGLRKGRF